MRGEKVMLSTDHRARFPDDFLFRLTKDEYSGLTSQIAISNRASQAGFGQETAACPLTPIRFQRLEVTEYDFNDGHKKIW